jgi:hypothetical protein
VRTEIQGVPVGLLSRRVGYILDDNGSHAAAGKPAAVEWVGVTGRREFLWVGKGGGAFQSRKSKRGAPKKFAAIEITAHAKDKTGSKACIFPREMRTIFLSLIIQFGGAYGLAGRHGKSDGHFLIINRTVSGKALRSTFPNNATPRRVMVAVCDRLEREFNRERSRLGEPHLKLMIEIRDDRDATLGRKSMHEQISHELLRNGGSVESVTDILKAMQVRGWLAGVVEKGNVTVKFSEKTPKKNYSLDLLLRGVAKAYERLKEQQHKKAKEERKENEPSRKPRNLTTSSKFLRKKTKTDTEIVSPWQTRDATPAEIAKWAKQIAIVTKTPKPSDQEIIEVLKHPIGVFRHLDSSGCVVIRDLCGNLRLRIPLADLSAAVAAAISQDKEGSGPKTPAPEHGLG